jgi:hypothetical protein
MPHSLPLFIYISARRHQERSITESPGLVLLLLLLLLSLE